MMKTLSSLLVVLVLLVMATPAMAAQPQTQTWDTVWGCYHSYGYITVTGGPDTTGHDSFNSSGESWEENICDPSVETRHVTWSSHGHNISKNGAAVFVEHESYTVDGVEDIRFLYISVKGNVRVSKLWLDGHLVNLDR